MTKIPSLETPSILNLGDMCATCGKKMSTYQYTFKTMTRTPRGYLAVEICSSCVIQLLEPALEQLLLKREEKCHCINSSAISVTKTGPG